MKMNSLKCELILDRWPSPGRVKPEERQMRLQVLTMGHGKLRRDPGGQAGAHGSIRQRHSRLHQVQPAPCRTMWTSRTKAAQESVARSAVPAERTRIARQQNRTPSGPDRYESMPEMSARRPGNL